jgi:trehalose/maltose hydrolase-like predicted phosphorylase
VVLDWDGTAVTDRRAPATAVRRRVERLCEAGVHVAVLSGTHVQNVDGQLRARPFGPGRLLLATNRGSELFEVRDDGPVLLHRRSATPAEMRSLDLAADRVSRELVARGLGGVVVSRLNRRKIDLLPEPAWADPPKSRIAELVTEVTTRLRAAGLRGLEDVVDLARAAAAEAGLPDPRVTSDAKHVEIGLTDKSDAMRLLLARFADVGVGPGLLLVLGDEFGALGGAQGSDSFMLVPEVARATVVSVGVEPSGVPDAVRWVGGGPARFLQLLDEQLLRLTRRRVPTIDHDPAWSVVEDGTDPLRHRVTETLFTTGAGGVAVRGSVEEAPSLPLLLAAGVYHQQGSQQQLLPGPCWTQLTIEPAPAQDVRVLDLRTGVLLREEVSAEGTTLRSLRFSSAARPGVMGLRAEADPARLRPGAAFRAPRGLSMAHGRLALGPWARVASDLGGGVGALARQIVTRGGDHVRSVERLVAVTADARRQPSLARAREALAAAVGEGFDRLLAEHRAAWAERWSAVDIRLPDDPEVERAVRYALFQLWCNTGDLDELAVGARGLSGPGYSGHVFWDADVFVLPALVTMDPAAARAMVRYRLHRLGAAKARARRTGGAGARFPWESAASGDDVTPVSVPLGAQPIPVVTGLQEEHITADVAWAAAFWARWTGRRLQVGAAELELLLETARYWASRCRTAPDGSSHIDGVVGPDEYHDSVDDNAFTNVMARWNLRAAAEAATSCGLATAETRAWLALADSLVDGYDPATGVYEQFRGYHALQPLVVTDLAPPPVAADVLFGRERVAASQIIKQPDVLMLHHLVPEEVEPGSLRPNLEHYLPRTAHGSTLSPAIMASLLARAGRPDDALALLRAALAIDLGDVHGMTAAGLHLGTFGGVWQAVVRGFVGAEVRGGALLLDPVLPTSWHGLEVRFRCLGRRVRVVVDGERFEVAVDGALLVGCPGHPPRKVSGTAVFSRPDRAARHEEGTMHHA